MNKKAVVCYLSYSGNTEEVAEIISDSLESNGCDVDLYRIGSGLIPDLSLYDSIFLGTFTWGKGGVPDEVKEFILKVGYKPEEKIYIFGTGDTQFGGDELFCKAVDKLVKFYNSSFRGLKIEQSPRGHQENIVREWTEGVVKKWKDLS